MVSENTGINVVLSLDEWRQVIDAMDCLACNTPDFLEAMEVVATLDRIDEQVGIDVD